VLILEKLLILPKQAVDQQTTPLSQAESSYVVRFIKETDEDGNYIRPWAVNENHKHFNTAVAITREVMNDPEMQFKNIKEKMEEVEKRLKQETGMIKKPAANVQKSDLTQTAKKNTIELSQQEQRVAVRMFPKLSQKEALEKYAKAKQNETKLKAGR
jgi:hypothetical protein